MKRLSKWLHRRCYEQDLSCYLDDQLSPAEVDRLEKHLAGCEECSQELESLRATIDLLKVLPVPCMPRKVVIPREAVVAQRQARRWDTAFVTLRAGALAVTAALAIMVSWDAFARLNQPGPMLATEIAYAVAEDTGAGAAGAQVPEDVAVAREAPVAAAEAATEGATPEESEESAAALALSAKPAEGEPTPEIATAMLAQEAAADTSSDTEAQPEGEPMAKQGPLARQGVPEASGGGGAEPLAAAPSEGLLAGAPPDLPGQRPSPPLAWTLPRIVTAALVGALAVIVGLLAWVARRRVRI